MGRRPPAPAWKGGISMGAIKRISLSQQVLTSILDYIRDNQLRVGDKLPTESEFSKRFQVSRTSVREAMKVLNFNGAVESIPGKGAFIREPMLSFLLNTEENLVDQANVSVSQVMEVRLAVELLAADLAIKRATEQDLEWIGAAIDDMRQAAAIGKPWTWESPAFHIRIAESTKNPLVVKLMESYVDTVTRYCETMGDFHISPAEHIRSHEAILNAIRARDPEAAHAAIHAHMEDAEQTIHRLVNKDSALLFMRN